MKESGTKITLCMYVGTLNAFFVCQERYKTILTYVCCPDLLLWLGSGLCLVELALL